MEIRFPTIDEGMPGSGDTVLGVGEVACDGLKPQDTPDDVIETHVTATLNGQTRKFVMLVPKST